MASRRGQALSLAGHRILGRLEIEMAHHGGNDNGRLPVTFDHFVEYGIHRHSIAPGLREVCALGFVEITEQSGKIPKNSMSVPLNECPVIVNTA
jgi:hypothetical protein